MNKLFEDLSPEDFLQVLPSPSREYAMSAFGAGADLTQIAVKLSVEPGEGLATKGGEQWPSDIVPRITKELRLLLCTDDPKYESIREKLKGEGTTTANVIVFVVSNAVAIHTGMAAALCVPLVALLLAAIAKLTLLAWCEASGQPAGPVKMQQKKSLEENKESPQAS